MHYFRLVPSSALLWKMVRGLFNILACLLPAGSLWLLGGFRYPVSDILYLEHLFLEGSPCCSHDGWRRMPAAPGNLPYLLGWGRFAAMDQICPKLSLGAVKKNKVNIDESLIKLLFLISPGEIQRLPPAQGLSGFHVNISLSELTFLLTKSSFDGVVTLFL